MNAPYDGDRGRAAGSSGYPEGPPPEHGQVPSQPPADTYFQDAYRQDPYGAQDLAAQDPVAEALYDRAAHPPPPASPQPQQPQQPLYGRPPQSPYAPDPRLWARTPAPEPERPAPYLPYGDDPRTTQYMGVDDLVGHAGDEHHEPDAFAHLFHDQQQGGPTPPGAPAAVPGPAGPAPVPGAQRGPWQGRTPSAPPRGTDATMNLTATPPAPEPVKKGGRASNLMKSSAVMAAGTMVSRLTGFVRSALIVSALGTALLGDTFQVAYQLPTMIYILTVGGGLNSVFVPQLVRAMKEDDDSVGPPGSARQPPEPPGPPGAVRSSPNSSAASPRCSPATPSTRPNPARPPPSRNDSPSRPSAPADPSSRCAPRPSRPRSPEVVGGS